MSEQQPVRLIALALFVIGALAIAISAALTWDEPDANASIANSGGSVEVAGGPTSTPTDTPPVQFSIAIDDTGFILTTATPTPTSLCPNVTTCPARSPYPTPKPGNGCDTDPTTALLTKCTLPASNSTFIVKVYLNDMSGAVPYAGFDAFLTYTGVSVFNPVGSAANSFPWPQCAFPASIPVTGGLRFGCAAGISVAGSTHTGLLGFVKFDCAPGGGTITLDHGASDTALDGFYAEGEGTSEMLSVNCGPPPTPTETPTATPTPCPTEGCPTPTATSAVSSPTATATATFTPTLSPTSTATATATATHTATSTSTATSTATATSTSTATATRTSTATATITPTFTVTNTRTNTATSTFTPTNTATITPTFTPTFTPTVTNTPTRTFTPTNTATITPTFTPTHTATPVNAPDLVVSKEASVDTTVSGGPIVYTIEARNVGDFGATNIVVIDEPDANFTYTGFSTTRGSCLVVGSLTGGTLECHIGSLATGAGAFADITVSGFVTAIVDVDANNTVTIDPDGGIPEHNDLNNSANAVVEVLGGEGSFTQGDVDGDGDIDAIDALWILWEEADIVDAVPVPPAADVDKDGDHDVIDALLVLQITVGLI